MEIFLIRGGKMLRGVMEVRGAKNSALKALAASLLFKNPIAIENVPQIEDVFRMQELLAFIGVRIRTTKHRTVELDAKTITRGELDPNIAERFRASIVLTGPLLARTKRITFPHPGGCVIGKRPIDIFLEGWKTMGAKVQNGTKRYHVSCQRFVGTDWTMRTTSVTATETFMMAGCLAKGVTILRNAARDPEILSIADFLNRMGANIQGAGTSTIKIVGRGGKLLEKRGRFRVIPDRIEAGSLVILGAALGNPLTIRRCNPEHLSCLLATLSACGVPIRQGKDWITVRRPRILEAQNIKTKEYPGFPTDLQAPFTVLMTQARGFSMIFETVFEERLNYIEELNRMGAQIIPCDPHRVMVAGPHPLHGREIGSPDIRAGLAFVIAALIGRGTSRIRNIYQIDRGYERLEERLKMVGADIERQNVS